MLFFISNNISSIDSGSTEPINYINRGYFEKISCSLNEFKLFSNSLNFCDSEEESF